MAHLAVNPPATGWSLTIPVKLWTTLADHLFSDGDEPGAVLLAGYADGPRGPRLLARDVILAADGTDFVDGTTSYRALDATFVRDQALRARDEKLVYLAVHNHADILQPGAVAFSTIDMASHERGYPALRQITRQIVGGLVLTPRAAAGDLWLPDGTRAVLAETVVPGNNIIWLRPRPAPAPDIDPRWDRQALLFGPAGQQTFARMRVAVVGLGGAGSIITELLARLGVGELVLIDGDRVEATNLPRLVAAEPDDVGELKVNIAARNARRANPSIQITAIADRVEHPDARDALTTCDWIFLAADAHSARHWVNLTVHQYLIPATQVGVKIPVGPAGEIGEIHTVARLLLPAEGCLWCNGLIDSTQLAIEMHSAADRRNAQYVPEVPAASVIALNALPTAEAVNHFMFAAVCLHDDPTDSASVLHHPRARGRALQDGRQDPDCPWCTKAGSLARGAGDVTEGAARLVGVPRAQAQSGS